MEPDPLPHLPSQLLLRAVAHATGARCGVLPLRRLEPGLAGGCSADSGNVCHSLLPPPSDPEDAFGDGRFVQRAPAGGGGRELTPSRDGRRLPSLPPMLSGSCDAQPGPPVCGRE